MTEIVDARGLSCPQPVLWTRKALLNAEKGEVVVLVDTMTQVHNCTRAAQKLGWEATYEEKDRVFKRPNIGRKFTFGKLVKVIPEVVIFFLKSGQVPPVKTLFKLREVADPVFYIKKSFS